MITQLLATHFDCSKQDNLRHFSFNWVAKCTQVPSKMNGLEHLLLILFVLLRKKKEHFAALQQFEKHKIFVLKVHTINGIDMIEGNGIVTHCHYPNNWTLMNAKITSATLMIRIVLN